MEEEFPLRDDGSSSYGSRMHPAHAQVGMLRKHTEALMSGERRRNLPSFVRVGEGLLQEGDHGDLPSDAWRASRCGDV